VKPIITPAQAQEILFENLINVAPHDSAHGPDWHRADCLCTWYSTGSKRNTTDDAYDHIASEHMLSLAKLLEALADAVCGLSAQGYGIDDAEQAIREAAGAIA
jgi:hypothetical protein